MAPLAVLVAGDINAIDTLGGVLHAFAPESVLLPFAHLQAWLAIGRGEQLYAESVALVIGLVTLEIAAIGYVSTMTVGFGTSEVALVSS